MSDKAVFTYLYWKEITDKMHIRNFQIFYISYFLRLSNSLNAKYKMKNVCLIFLLITNQ